MRRTFIVALLACVIALPVAAQHRGPSSAHGGGTAGARSTPQTHWGSRPSIGFGGGIGFRGSSFVAGAGVSFGHGGRTSVIVSPRQFHQPRHWITYPYSHSYSAVYTYVYYPAYPLAYYDAYDYAAVPVAVQPTYTYEYASGSDNYPAEPGLVEQMRQQRVGVYAQPAAPYPQRAPVTAAPERPATVLIYRDGRSAEIKNYAVVGQTLWIFSEDRAQRVPLTQLDLDATKKANEERGIEFVLPR